MFYSFLISGSELYMRAVVTGLKKFSVSCSGAVKYKPILNFARKRYYVTIL